MGIPTPFHSRTSALCTSLQWREWAGYFAVSRYGATHDTEYFAFREAAGLLDVTPLYKYDVTGRDALALANRIATRDMEKVAPDMATYTCWCDEEGKIIEEGTLFRMGEDRVRFNTTSPTFRWLHQCAVGFEVEILDRTEEIAAVAVQGPTSRDLLVPLCDFDLAKLPYFGLASGRLGRIPALVSRTGYTGDLGYEIWVSAENAESLWDLLMAEGKPWGLIPAGLLALDGTRIEAGFILADVDYTSAHKAMIESRESTPYELSLGWSVHLNKAPPFIGQEALAAEKRRGPARRLVGLELDWPELERLYDAVGLAPEICSMGWRTAVPVYSGRRQIGRATSGVWSPILKKNLALATLDAPFARLKSRVEIEWTVDYVRHKLPATVVRRPFLDLARRKA